MCYTFWKQKLIAINLPPTLQASFRQRLRWDIDQLQALNNADLSLQVAGVLGSQCKLGLNYKERNQMFAAFLLWWGHKKWIQNGWLKGTQDHDTSGETNEETKDYGKSVSHIMQKLNSGLPHAYSTERQYMLWSVPFITSVYTLSGVPKNETREGQSSWTFLEMARILRQAGLCQHPRFDISDTAACPEAAK